MEATAPDGGTVAVGDPSLIGLPLFLVGSVALGLVLVGFVRRRLPVDRFRSS
jgi:hypothetical protein